MPEQRSLGRAVGPSLDHDEPTVQHLQFVADMEQIHAFKTPVTTDGVVYRVEAWGGQRDDGHFEGWLRFVPPDGRDILATGRETTQPNRGALVYWATGLEPVYLEGAFERAAGRRSSAA